MNYIGAFFINIGNFFTNCYTEFTKIVGSYSTYELLMLSTLLMIGFVSFCLGFAARGTNIALRILMVFMGLLVFSAVVVSVRMYVYGNV